MLDSQLYFKLTSNIDLNDINFDDDYLCEYFNGELDGNGHEFTLTNSMLGVFANAYESATFSNLKLILGTKRVMLCSGVGCDNTEVIFNDISIECANDDTSIELGKNEGLFVDWVGHNNIDTTEYYKKTMLTINCCNVYCNITGTNYNTVFIGGGLFKNSIVTISNSCYYGTYTGEYVNLILGNASTRSYYPSCSLNAEYVINSGVLIGFKRIPMLAAGYSSTEYVNGTFTDCDIGLVTTS